METLVQCPCGHALARHDYEGCSGDRLRGCSCKRDKHAALDAAVDSVKTVAYPADYAVTPAHRHVA